MVPTALTSFAVRLGPASLLRLGDGSLQCLPLQPLEPLGPWRSISVVLTLATTEYDVLLVILNQNQ